MLGGLRLSPNRRPVRSRPRSSSLLLEPLLPRASPSLPCSRHRPLAYAPPLTMPIALPVGEMLPIGELVPLLRLRLPERSRSENEDVRVDERPRELDPERESLEWYDEEPVVVLPLTLGEWGIRPRVGAPSEGERSVESAQTLVLGAEEGREFGRGDAAAWACAGLTRGTGTAREGMVSEDAVRYSTNRYICLGTRRS